MSSFEWMELQTLTSDIAESRSRLAAARSSKDQRLTRALEQEIRSAEDRRSRLLAHITSHVASAADQVPRADAAADAAGPEPVSADEGAADAAPNDTPEDVAEAGPAEAEPPAPDDAQSERPARLAGRTAAKEAASPVSAVEAGPPEGGIAVWDQLTPNDIEHAKNELGVRRAEMLARHAEELKGLEADMTQLEGLEQAIAAFARKFRSASQNGAENGAVVTLEEERGLRVGRN